MGEKTVLLVVEEDGDGERAAGEVKTRLVGE